MNSSQLQIQQNEGTQRQSIAQSENNIFQYQIIEDKKQPLLSFYRPDIDGLRAIAVGIVVIFHAWPQFMTGGFIGVDIFFVISGFLISKIIIKEIEEDKFTYFRFYNRRIKRIYPALITILLSVFLFACWKLMQRQIQILTKTMFAASIFGANIQILTYQKGYFDPDVKTNPLLHLWSLGVQEQFYIIWPFLMSIVICHFKKKGFICLLFFGLLSFILSIYSVFLNSKFAFYFPLCRFWEMTIGGLIAFKSIQLKNKIITNILSILSLLMVFYGIFKLNEDSLFPGFWALIPTVGATCIILSKGSIINQYLLTNSLIVFIGKISYPLYLWHWPLLVYSRIFFPQGSDSIFSKPQVIIFLAILFSTLTYFFIQNPLRFRKSNKISYFLLTIMLIIGITALIAHKMPKQFSYQGKLLQKLKQSEKIIENQTLKQILKNQQKNIQNQKITHNYSKVIHPEQLENKNKQKNQKQSQIEQNKNKQKNQKQSEIKQKYSKQNSQFKQIQKPINNNTNSIQLQKLKQQKNNINNQKFIFPQKQYDFIQKKGKKLVNSSKNKKRLKPTVDQIKTNINPSFGVFQSLQKRINPRSKYFDNQANQLHIFDILNQDNQNNNNTLFVVGDSHAWMMGPRFIQLHKQSLINNKTKTFPTIISLAQSGRPLLPCYNFYNYYFNYIKKHIPTRVLFVNRWNFLLTIDENFRNAPLQSQKDLKNRCSRRDYFQIKGQGLEDIKFYIKNFTASAKQIKDLGVQVYVATINPEGQSFNPRNMADYYKIIDKNINPIKLSEWRHQNKDKIDLFENSLKQAGLNIIDFSDHYCWQDVCQVLTPYGYPIMRDHHHFTKNYAQYWASSVDFLTEF